MLPVWSTIRKTWTVFLIFQSQIICIRGDCGPPPVIEHTLPVEETPGVQGTTVVYKCDRSTGYYESPGKSSTITCQDDNKWSILPEFCARGCGVPVGLRYAVLKDSDLKKDIFLPGTSVSYDCRAGFKRVARSNNSITCLHNYTWSTPSEFCELKECGHPGEPENGLFEATNHFYFGSKVTYECNEGYRLTSKRAYRDCQADGKWSNTVPHCEAVPCPAPVRPDNGIYSPEKDDYIYLDAVTFTCNKDFHVIGASTASCTGDGTWSTNSPNCTVVNCPDPGPLENGRRLSGFVGPYTLNSAVRFVCAENFDMDGLNLITCNVDSQWKPEIPKCLTVCDTPLNYPYAEFEGRSANVKYFDKTTVIYKCKPGYIRDPNKLDHITCSGRSWSELAQFCSPISCDDPGEVMYAHKSSSEFTFGSTVNYTCQDGYKITSSINYRKCQADGTWSPGDIVCSATCQVPEVANSQLNLHLKRVYVQYDVLVFECERDYFLIGSSTITCSSRGQWEPSLPECKMSRSGLSSGAIAGIIIGCLLVVIAAGLLCWCCSKNKSGEYFCENKNDKFKQTLEQELTESNKKTRKPKSETPNVQYSACNDA